MSYTKHTWIDGELITADKLNNLEEGVSSVVPTTTGYLSDGDTFTVTSSEGSVKKMVWREIAVPLSITDEFPNSVEEFPNIDSSINTEDFYDLLNFKYNKLLLRATINTPTKNDTCFPCVSQFIEEQKIGETTLDIYNVMPATSSGATFPLQVGILPAYNKAVTYASGLDSDTLASMEISLVIGGFLPIEE